MTINTPTTRQAISDLMHDELRMAGVHDESIRHVIGKTFVLLDEASAADGEPLHEVTCPQCGATIRARMADAPDATKQHPRTWAPGFDDDNEAPRDLTLTDPAGRSWTWSDAEGGGWINDPESASLPYDWDAALDEAGALREVTPDA